MASTHLPWVINFANSIVGVGVLAIPFCFHKCGIVMAILLILAANIATKATCDFLLKAAQKLRISGFESLSFAIVGPIGKLLTELCTIGLLLGTLVAFQVVLGDLAPTIVHNIFGVEESWDLRAVLMCLSCAAIIPLSLMRNISSLAGMNAMSMGFYSFFVLLIGGLSLGNILSLQWWAQVNFWQPAGFFHCLPIISLAFSCQTQVFVMYEALPDASVNAMNDIIDKAINLVTTIYISVGFLGYVAFYDQGIRGDILANFPSGLMTDGIKAGFWFSVVISFPLILFPVRLAIYSLFFGRKKNTDVISSANDYIPQGHFNAITLMIVGGTLIVGITIPHIETVLSVTGACIGTFLCFVLPSALFLAVWDVPDRAKLIAKIILVLGLFSMVASTVTVLSGTGSSPEPHKVTEAHATAPKVPVTQVFEPAKNVSPLPEKHAAERDNVISEVKREEVKLTGDSSLVRTLKKNEQDLTPTQAATETVSHKGVLSDLAATDNHAKGRNQGLAFITSVKKRLMKTVDGSQKALEMKDANDQKKNEQNSVPVLKEKKEIKSSDLNNMIRPKQVTNHVDGNEKGLREKEKIEPKNENSNKQHADNSIHVERTATKKSKR